ncbi:hypothetical protein BDN71DRAFT_1457708 [Pleurotus eryngii]|uniref:Uncharacterized protein n=1 Tax=Pleurotus eryngii TaxID=5323 RepID=A0A9P6D0X3_PLEER|nr:hypothetical protein BDN71DRAFT_1457708 [Pleurotus eryngii]
MIIWFGTEDQGVKSVQFVEFEAGYSPPVIKKVGGEVNDTCEHDPRRCPSGSANYVPNRLSRGAVFGPARLRQLGSTCAPNVPVNANCSVLHPASQSLCIFRPQPRTPASAAVHPVQSSRVCIRLRRLQRPSACLKLPRPLTALRIVGGEPSTFGIPDERAAELAEVHRVQSARRPARESRVPGCRISARRAGLRT